MESGKDVSEGGAKYNRYGGTATGLATTADSLTALKYIVYDKKIAVEIAAGHILVAETLVFKRPYYILHAVVNDVASEADGLSGEGA